MRKPKAVVAAAVVAAAALVFVADTSGGGGGGPMLPPGCSGVTPFECSVVQDCWTTRPSTGFPPPDPRELENYLFSVGEPITFVWKHKLWEYCPSYIAAAGIYPCTDGKPRIGVDTMPVFGWFTARGPVEPDPLDPEVLFDFTLPQGMPPGCYDWLLVVECDLSGNGIDPAMLIDGDPDDICGFNEGVMLLNTPSPLAFGADPIAALDVDPGGAPTGRVAGENGTTRPWYFTVLAP